MLVAESYNDIAQDMVAKYKSKDAIKKSTEKLLRFDLENVAMITLSYAAESYHNVGAILEMQWKWTEALEMYQRAYHTSI